MLRTTLALLAALALSAPAHAEQIRIPVGQQDAGNLTLPKHGESKDKVLETHGIATREHKPVGQPPITRWDYPEFSVYFEHDHVINSVVHHRPRAEAQPEAEAGKL